MSSDFFHKVLVNLLIIVNNFKAYYLILSLSVFYLLSRFSSALFTTVVLDQYIGCDLPESCHLFLLLLRKYLIFMCRWYMCLMSLCLLGLLRQHSGTHRMGNCCHLCFGFRDPYTSWNRDQNLGWYSILITSLVLDNYRGLVTNCLYCILHVWRLILSGLSSHIELFLLTSYKFTRTLLQTWIHWVCQIGSIVVFFAFSLIYNIICPACSPPSNPYFIMERLVQTPTFWFSILLITAVALFPRFVIFCFVFYHVFLKQV